MFLYGSFQSSWGDAGTAMAELFPEGTELWAGARRVPQAGCASSAHRGTGRGQRDGWDPKQTIKMFFIVEDCPTREG